MDESMAFLFPIPPNGDGGAHDRLDETERVSDVTWLNFLRHHPDLHVMARRIRRES